MPATQAGGVWISKHLSMFFKDVTNQRCDSMLWLKKQDALSVLVVFYVIAHP